VNCLDPKEYPEPVKECWAVHQALRALGFKPEDIYVALGKDAMRPLSTIALFVVLRVEGKEFIVTLAVYDSEAEAEVTLTLWSAFVDLFNDQIFDDVVMDDIYEGSNVIQNKVAFIVALQNKGLQMQGDVSALS
jgi:hypothetical protein